MLGPAIQREADRPRPVQVELLTDRLETPSLDDRTYRVIRLPNQLEIFLCHDPDTDKASASMDVNVGAFSDEDDMPGMAHAVEHLLFMGTEKFPVENSYSHYLSAHSGHSNAYTGSMNTNFYFDVAAKPADDQEPSAENPSPLLGALDRFAQFFVKPLFLEGTLDRELQAVDSENKKNLQNDMWRLHQLEKSLSNPKHPYCHFSTGTLETLKTLPESRGVKVRAKFIEFYEKHYSANLMKLCILGREPLDLLESWASAFFSDIENKKLKRGVWVDEDPFDKEHVGIQWFAKPVMDSREVAIILPFLDETDHYESQPGRFISHLVGHEGPGSIMAYIKSKGWANGLSSGAYSTVAGSPGMFETQVSLTEEGLKNYREIVKVFFQYVSMLRENALQEWIFEEQKGIAEVNFKFKQKSNASRFTSKMSATMQKPLPREWLLSGYSKMRKFEPHLVRKGLDCLRPEKLRLMVVSRDFPGDWDSKEKFYGTEYRCEKIPADFMKELGQAVAAKKEDRIAALHLPHKNQFVPTKLEVEKKEVKEPGRAPKIVRNDAVIRTWFKKDDTFWVPKANLSISCRSPLVWASAKNAVTTEFLVDLVRDALEEYSYDAELAGLTHEISVASRGLLIEVSGYNDKLPVLLEQVLVTIRDLDIRPDRFGIIKERMSRRYRNWELSQPYEQIHEFNDWLLTPTEFLTDELSKELASVTADNVRHLRQEILGQMHMECHIHGNFYREEALRLTNLAESILKTRPLPQSHWPIKRSLLLPPGANYLWKKTHKDPANVNHAIEAYFALGDKFDRNLRARALLLDQILHEPVFDQLRTKEQLGYIVFSGIRGGPATYGFRILIQSEKETDYVDQRIDLFLASWDKRFRDMAEAEFESHKRALIVQRLEKPKFLNQETGKHFVQINNETYDFESSQRDVAHIKPITKASMEAFFMKHVHPSSPTRSKLTVALVAQAKSDVSTKQISELIETLGLTDEKTKNCAAADLQARLSAGGHDVELDIKGLRDYLQHDLLVAEANIDKAAEAWRKLHNKTAESQSDEQTPEQVVSNGSPQVLIEDVRTFKATLPASAGPKSANDISDFEDLDSKL